jgi:Lon protease-like protein
VPKRYEKLSDFPDVIPVFPLPGALLLPQTDLPLNIFEPRYVAMVEEAMAGGRLIGMIQTAGNDSSAAPNLAPVGCVGRITSYAETEDNRLHISLAGVCRFRVLEEVSVTTPYRQVRVDFAAFADDLQAGNGTDGVDRSAVIKAFRQYLEAHNMSANWDEVDRIPTGLLVNTLSQLAPYPALEKQALLEAQDIQARADMLIALTERSLSRPAGKMVLQ